MPRGLSAASEVVFGLLSPAWRLDPAAVAVFAPISQAIRAIRSRAISFHQWRDAVGAVRAHGSARRRGG
eukprot:812052-Lingulodinium_polyedra.AAC.1